MIEDLGAILGFARSSTADVFAQRYPHPALTFWIPDRLAPLSDDATTLNTTMNDEGIDQLLLTIQKRNRVGWLTKTCNNYFANIISVGRAPSNDLQIPLETISKIHAVFSQIGTSWRVSDQNTTNGLTVNHSKISPNQPFEIKDGDRIRFGQEVDSTFHTPNGLFNFLRNLVPPA
jgi:pSer/pThr/pTyr-binding forkhead associated (FHA) protein